MSASASLFRNMVFVGGLLLLVSGVGNTMVAHFKLHEYRTVLSQTPAPAETEQVLGKTGRLQYFSSEAWSRRALSQAKLDFYQVLHTIGWLMLGTGVVCTLMAVRRQRYRRPSWAPPTDSPFVVEDKGTD